MKGRVDNAWNFVVLAVLVYIGIGALRTASPGGVAAIIALLVLIPFVLGPVLIRQTYWSSLEPGLAPFDPSGPGSPEVLRSQRWPACSE